MSFGKPASLMGRPPNQRKMFGSEHKSTSGTMPVFGMNAKDDPQLLDTRRATLINNYLVLGAAHMDKRGGSILDFNTGDSNVVELSGDFQNNYHIQAYGTKVRAWDTVNKLFIDIKTNFSANSGWSGDRYGDYFFVNNNVDGLWRINQSIGFTKASPWVGNVTVWIQKASGGVNVGDSIYQASSGASGVVTAILYGTTGGGYQIVTINSVAGAFTVANGITGGTLVSGSPLAFNFFAAGQIITGGTSGAKAVALEQSTSSVAALGAISGTFINGETLTTTNGITATATSSLGFTITQVAGAPLASKFGIIGTRAILIGLATDIAGYNYSVADTSGNPPFTDWSISTGINGGGAGSNRNGGQAYDVALIGDTIFIGQAKGWYAFKISQTALADNTGAAVSSKYDQPVNAVRDFAVFRCVMTHAGLIVHNTAGIFRLVSLGQMNIPYSEQWECLTDDLGPNYFNDVNFATSDLTLDYTRGFIFSTIAKTSNVNNLVLAIKVNIETGQTSNVKNGATSLLTGWNIRRFVNVASGIYGTSAAIGQRYALFVGQNDLGSTIHTEYTQELPLGLGNVFKLGVFKAGAFMSPASLLKISFDTYDEYYHFRPRRRGYTWVVSNKYISSPSGWGKSGFGTTGWSGGSSASGLVPDETGANVKLRQLTRAILRFESDDAADHTLRWFIADSVITKQVRVRTLNQTT